MRTLSLVLAWAACGAPSAPQEAPRFVRASYPVEGPGPAALAAADVNADGAVDLLVSSGEVRVLLGDGHGAFRTAPSVAAGENPAGLATADFNGDGRPDLAVANHETDGVTILLGQGGGTFRPAPGSPVRPGIAPHPHAVVAGDVDGDGVADLFVDDRDGHRMVLLIGLGDGRFEAPRGVPVGGDPYREPWLGDLDGDGRRDLVTPNEGSLALLRGDGTGAFVPFAASPTRVPDPFAVTAADVNGDGVLDLASATGERGEGVTVLLGSPDGAFRPAPGSPFPGFSGPGRIAAGDVNGDGYDDLVAGGWARRTVLLLMGGAETLAPFFLEAGANPWSVLVTDLDGDGHLDVVAGNEGDGDLTVFLNRGVPAAGEGTGRW